MGPSQRLLQDDFHHGTDRLGLTKWFLHHQPRILLGPINDGRSNEISRSIRIFASDSHIPVFLIDLAEKAFDALILHRVLDRPQEDTFFVSLAKFQGLGVLHHRVTELLEDFFVHKDAFDGQAYLVRVSYLSRMGLEVEEAHLA